MVDKTIYASNVFNQKDEIACPHCQVKLGNNLFCDGCGRILPVTYVFDRNYFTFFSLDISFKISIPELVCRLNDILDKLHPDRFVNALPFEREIAIQNSALYNKAYSILSCPLRRAQYMLELRGYDLGSNNSSCLSNDNVLVMDAFIWRERLEKVNTLEESQILVEEFQCLSHKLIEEIGNYFNEQEYDAAYQCYIKLRFISRFQQEIIEKMNALL